MSDAAQLDRRRELAGAQTRPCVTSSFQAECVVLMHMLREIAPDIPVLFLDTLHHFPQTLAYRDELAARWGLNLITCGRPEPQPGLWQQRARRRAARGTRSSRSSRALEDYDTWFTALRRDQSPSRANLQEVEPFRLPSGTDPAQGQPARRVDHARTSGPTPRRTTSRCCRSTSSATPASAASRARRCRSIPSTRARAAGRARSSNAGSIFRRSESGIGVRDPETADADPISGTPVARELNALHLRLYGPDSELRGSPQKSPPAANVPGPLIPDP